MDFENGEELLECCRTNNCLISDVMRNREIETGHASEQEVAEKLQKVYEILTARASLRAERYTFGRLKTGTVMVTLKGKILGMDSTAKEIGRDLHWNIKSL